MGFMHDTLRYMAREPIYRKYHHDLMTFGMVYAFSENFILPISHDEVVHGKGSLIRQMAGDRWQKFANLRAYFGFMWTHPGKKLLFMGGEFAQDREWNHDQSLDWHLLQYREHAGVQVACDLADEPRPDDGALGFVQVCAEATHGRVGRIAGCHELRRLPAPDLRLRAGWTGDPASTPRLVADGRDVLDRRAALRGDEALGGGALDDGGDLGGVEGGRDLILRLDPQAVQHPVGEAVEPGDDGAEKARDPHQGRGEPPHGALRGGDGDVLGHHLPGDDVQAHDDDQGNDDCDGVGAGAPDTDGREVVRSLRKNGSYPSGHTSIGWAWAPTSGPCPSNCPTRSPSTTSGPTS